MQILYATDGSEGALAGAKFLASVPLGPDTRIRLLRVEEEKPEATAAVTAAALSAARQILRFSAAQVEEDIRAGRAAEEILRAAEEQPTDLVVVGHRGVSALSRFFLGSVAERVVRHAPCPVLIARPLKGPLDLVLVGMDGSEGAQRAVDWLQRLPLPPCEIRLACVLLDPKFLGHSEPVLAPILSEKAEQSMEQDRQQADEHLAQAAGHLRDAIETKQVMVVPDVLWGDPAQRLIETAESGSDDLIVVGSHRRAGMTRFLLGSVSEKVMRHAPCSVLVVRTGGNPSRG